MDFILQNVYKSDLCMISVSLANEKAICKILYHYFFDPMFFLKCSCYHFSFFLLLLKFIYFLLKDNCFTEFCCFLSNLTGRKHSPELLWARPGMLVGTGTDLGISYLTPS